MDQLIDPIAPEREADLVRTHPIFGGLREECWWPEMIVRVTRLAKNAERVGRLVVENDSIWKVSTIPSGVNVPQLIDDAGQEAYKQWLAIQVLT